MKELTYRINLRNVQGYIEDDFIGMLSMYKKHVLFLTCCALRNREKPPTMFFEEPELNNVYVSMYQQVMSMGAGDAVQRYVESLMGFEKDVFVDLTYYIDDIVRGLVSDFMINVVSITINRFYELEFTVKQFVKRAPKQI